MKNLILSLWFLFCFMVSMPQQAPKEPIVAEPVISLTNEQYVKGLMVVYSNQYKVPYEVMDTVIRCETSGTYDPKIQSGYYRNGKREESYGVVQINLPSWPTITYEQATTAEFAVEFLAKKLKEGKGHLWTCYRTHYE